MATIEKTTVVVATTIQASAEKVWEHWTSPQHIRKWNNASDDWHTPWAKSDLVIGGGFLYRMEAKDGSFGFDFGGTYNKIEPEKHLAYTIGDGRKVTIGFEEKDGATTVTETFETESLNPVEMQRDGWQAILDNFKKYVEAA